MEELFREEDEVAAGDYSVSSSYDATTSTDPGSKSNEESKESSIQDTGHLQTENRTPGHTPGWIIEPMATAKGSDSRKRKPSTNPGVVPDTFVSTKKVKRDGTEVQSLSLHPHDPSFLPAEIWHHIFTFTTPRALSSLSMTNKIFNIYLDPMSSFELQIPRVTSQSRATFLKPDAIWRNSRGRFWPRMPSPLYGKTELSMWQLICRSGCQYCGKKAPPDLPLVMDESCLGPGTDSVSIIWALWVKSCGPCLLSNTTKVSEGMYYALYMNGFLKYCLGNRTITLPIDTLYLIARTSFCLLDGQNERPITRCSRTCADSLECAID